MPPANPPSSPLPTLLLILSFTTGLVDAVSVLGLGKVFTANMTGNVVFLGFAAAGAPGFYAPPYIVAILFFLTGAAIGGRSGKSLSLKPLKHWFLIAATVETSLLWLAAAIAIGFDRGTEDWRLYAIIALTAIAMGFRNSTVRQFKVPDLTTTVLTLTLTGLAADSEAAGGKNTNWARRLGAVASILVGAIFGAILVLRFELAVPLVLTGAIILIGSLIAARHPMAAHPLT